MKEPLRDRNIDHLDADLRRKVAAILDELSAAGYHPFIIETRRTAERQKWLRTQKPPVTHVRHSRHQDGEACDIGFAKQGRAVWSVLFPGWRQLGKCAANHGLTWGGKWLKFKDFPHVELCKGSRRRQPPTA